MDRIWNKNLSPAQLILKSNPAWILISPIISKSIFAEQEEDNLILIYSDELRSQFVLVVTRATGGLSLGRWVFHLRGGAGLLSLMGRVGTTPLVALVAESTVFTSSSIPGSE